MSKITPVTFLNRNNLKLFGIYYQPMQANCKDTAIVLLSPGVKTRVAPHRLYKKMAEEFFSLGYRVFRFDYYGLGDSEGEIDDYYLADFYGTVGVGRYIEDTQDALDWIEKQYGVSKVLFAGLCGGALTGLLTGADDERVVGLLGLGAPVILDSTNIDKSKYVTQGQLNQLKAGYISKLTNPKAWLRLLTFKSDFRVIFKILGQLIGRTFSLFKPNNKEKIEQSSNKVDMSNFNYLFPPAFFKMASGARKLLLVFSGADRLAWEFDEKFVSQYQAQLSCCTDNYEIYKIEYANHILSDKKWVAEMLSHSKRWLEKYFV